MMYLVMAMLVLLMFAPVFAILSKNYSGKKAKYSALCNIFSFIALFIISTIFVFTPSAFASETAATVAQNANNINTGLGYLAAGLAVGFSTIGAGIAVASAASAAIGASSENPKLFGRVIIFVALGEAIPLYGLLIAFLLINKL